MKGNMTVDTFIRQLRQCADDTIIYYIIEYRDGYRVHTNKGVIEITEE